MLFQPPQSGKIASIFQAESELQCLLDVEAALARAEARCGIIPQFAAEAIATQCKAELFDIHSLVTAATNSGNIAIPVVSQLTKNVCDSNPEAAAFVHWGATSQDIIDTALVLQLRTFFTEMDSELRGLSGILAKLIAEHKATIMAGRTWMQQAVPITLGLKLAGSLDAVLRHRQRLEQTQVRVLTLQFGGAAGTLASLGDKGLNVADALADGLELPRSHPWHAHRDRIVEVGSVCGLITTTVGKLGRDLSLLAQSEVNEVAEPELEGVGGSSSMPHKRNPVALASILTAATRMPGLLSTLYTAAWMQEHERGLGGWPAEWAVLPEICIASGSSLATLNRVLGGLKVNSDTMRRTVDRSGGQLLAESVSMALAQFLGKQTADQLVKQLTKQSAEANIPLETVLMSDPLVQRHFSPEKVKSLLEPTNYLGSTHAMIQDVLSAYRAQEDD
jgi:3-carboxy-cis,cis-muconate cycloisomerase